jgi:hypothetical protein
MAGRPDAAVLFRVAVGRSGRELQLVVGLIQQIFGLLSMALHVPLIGFLRVKNSLPGLAAQPLGGRKIGMPGAGDVPRRLLSCGDRSQKKKGAKDTNNDTVFDHSEHLVD